jgi:hypothetical protein
MYAYTVIPQLMNAIRPGQDRHMKQIVINKLLK